MVKNSSILKQEVFKALRYNSAAKILEVLFAITYGVFMARMLGPSIFGILAMASIFTGISVVFIDFGTGDAIIRHDEDKTSHEFLSSIFWLNVFIGLFVSIILILLSSFIANYFGHKIIKTIIIIYSINIVFAAMSNVPRSLIRKRMDFKSIFLQRAIILPISGVVGVYMVLNGYGIWSIITQQVVATTVGSFLFLYFSKWFPLFSLKRKHIDEIFHFSSYLSATKFLSYFTKKGDLFLIGKILGDYQLGLYSKGYQLTVKMLKTINGIIIGVLYPSLSKIKNDDLKLRRSFISVSHTMISIYGFITLFGSLFSYEIVKILLGDKWIELSILMPVFLLLSLILSLGSVCSHYIKAIGESKKIFNISIITTTATIFAFIIGIKWGIMGVAIGYVIAMIFSNIISLHVTSSFINISITEYYLMLTKELAMLILIGLIIKYINSYYNIGSDLTNMIVFGIIALIGYLLYQYASKSALFNYIKMALKN
jgi:O-antigen/teichoic acid export membrane protein